MYLGTRQGINLPKSDDFHLVSWNLLMAKLTTSLKRPEGDSGASKKVVLFLSLVLDRLFLFMGTNADMEQSLTQAVTLVGQRQVSGLTAIITCFCGTLPASLHGS